MKSEGVRVALKSSSSLLAASEICGGSCSSISIVSDSSQSPIDEKIEKMKKNPPNWANRAAHLRTIFCALFLRGDYVSTKYGGANGMVVASCIPFSPAVISGVFLYLFPLGFYALTLWLGTLLVTCLGAVIHGAASALGVGYGFSPDLSLVSHIVGVSLMGFVRMWCLVSGLSGSILAIMCAVSAALFGFYTYRETVHLLKGKFSQEPLPSKKTLLYPVRQLHEQILDILRSPPIAGRNRGDQYYINELNGGQMGLDLGRGPSGPKLANVVGVVRQ